MSDEDAQVTIDVVWAELLATRAYLRLQTRLYGELVRDSEVVGKIVLQQSKLILLLMRDWEARGGSP